MNMVKKVSVVFMVFEFILVKVLLIALIINNYIHYLRPLVLEDKEQNQADTGRWGIQKTVVNVLFHNPPHFQLNACKTGKSFKNLRQVGPAVS